MAVALVGLGYWGPNLLRTFNKLDVIKAAFDLETKNLEKFATLPEYKHIYFDTDWETCLGRSDIDGVVIATPPDTHYKIAMKALKFNKHLFIEKPMSLKIKEAEKIIEVAKEKNLIVMVGHIFLYSPEIIKLKSIINSDEFGDILYIYTQRLNLGKIQSPANVVEDLAPHDISIINYLLDDVCEEVQVAAKAHIIETEDIAFINMKYKKGVFCNLHLSWLDPFKIRSTVVVGTKQMAACDSGEKKIKVYNKCVNIENRKEISNRSYADHLMNYNYGDVISPYIQNYEPMVEECQEFLDCIKENRHPLASGKLGAEVVKTLNAMQKSLKGNGKWVNV